MHCLSFWTLYKAFSFYDSIACSSTWETKLLLKKISNLSNDSSTSNRQYFTIHYGVTFEIHQTV